MKYSENWVTWKTNVGPGTCDDCLSRNKKIFSIDELIERDEPPLHPNCRCERLRMLAIIAGTATRLGTNGADWWVKYLGELPEYYIHQDIAEDMGWRRKKGNLAEVLPGYMVYEDYKNKDGVLPQKEGRKWYAADLNYIEGYRNDERVVYSNDGLIFATFDHYETFIEIVGEEN